MSRCWQQLRQRQQQQQWEQQQCCPVQTATRCRRLHARHKVKTWKAIVPEPLSFCVFCCARHACSRLQRYSRAHRGFTD
jgi:hypothetical protein